MSNGGGLCLETKLNSFSPIDMNNSQLPEGARNAPNDLKLSDGGSWRTCCAVGLLGAACVTAVAVRCSAWLGDGSFDLVHCARILQFGICVFGVIVAADALRIVRNCKKDLERRKKEYGGR